MDMLAAVWYGPRDLKLERRRRPEVAPKTVLIRVRAVGVCGSDIHIYRGARLDIVPPVILGHEACGTVEQIGSEVNEFHVGDRVVIEDGFPCKRCYFCKRGLFSYCRDVKGIGYQIDGAYAEYIAVPKECLLKLPDEVTFEEGALIDSLACTIHGVERANVQMGDTAVIFGAGAAGLCFVQLLKLRGAARVVVVDTGRVRKKLELAKQFGAEEIITSNRNSLAEEVMRSTCGIGADLVIEASGDPNAIALGARLLRMGGRLIVYATYERLLENLDPNQIIQKELDILGSFGSTGSTYATAINLIASKRVELKSMITHLFLLTQITKCFEVMDKKLQPVVKAVIQP